MHAQQSKVMLVEDERSFAYALSDVLTQEGMDVTVTSDAKTALGCLSKEKYDLLLLDLMLPPDIDAEPSDWGYRTGIKILHWLRQNDNNTPVIVLSVVRDKAIIGQAEDYGVVSYIPKPASVGTILREIRQALARDQTES